MQDQHRSSRRSFLLKASAAFAVPTVITTNALGGPDKEPASERIVMGSIGVGGRGGGNARHFAGRQEVQMVASCDVVMSRAKQHAESYGKGSLATQDFRDITSRDDIDAVCIGTPDHWHAIITIEACKNGKDVFCEKPETLTVLEGRAMANAVKRYNRVFSGGSQRVLGDHGHQARIVWSGGIGKVKYVHAQCGGPSGPCRLAPVPVPADLDWDMWLGPAPYRPFHPSLISGGFRPYRDYSGGGMTDWGAHRFGSAMFAIGKHKEGPVEILPPNRDAGIERLTYRFKDGVEMYHGGGKGGIHVVGTEGETPGNHREAQPSDMPEYKGRGGLAGDFLHCVKTREEPFRDIESAHRACTVCHLGNLAYWLKRPLKWDPDKEEIIGDAEAARCLDRARREPWRL
jgi:hypothetical protein